MLLSENEVNKRLIRLRNLENLHLKARERIIWLEKENEKLRKRIKELEDRNKDQNSKIEALSFQFEQIKNKLFGKKPEDLRIIQKKSIRIFFEEDIPLPIQKIVVRHEVEVGYCNSCKRQSSGISIPSKKSVLGENIRKYVCILSIANRMSHNQIKENIKDIFDMDISIGEIGNILQTETDNLRPEYQGLKESVLNQTGTHYDETGWKVQKENLGKFAWVATGTENFDTVFDLGKSRGKGNIENIGVGKVGISDDYGAYKNAFPEHQLCWAHPQRKLRDMAESGEFGKREKKQILK